MEKRNPSPKDLEELEETQKELALRIIYSENMGAIDEPTYKSLKKSGYIDLMKTLEPNILKPYKNCKY